MPLQTVENTRNLRNVRQIGGVVVGGLLLGGVGAIIGGLSGKTETSGKISRIDLRLIVNEAYCIYMVC